MKDELAGYAAERLYSPIRMRFHSCHDTTRFGIFNEYGYLFAGWTKTHLGDSSVHMGQEVVVLEWFSDGALRLKMRLNMVPDMSMSQSRDESNADHLVQVAQVDEDN